MDENNVNQMPQVPEGGVPPTEEQKPKKSKRDALRERVSKKYPDDNFDDDEVFAGRVNDDYDDYEKRISDYEKNDQALADLMASDPRSSTFLMDWKDGTDPVIALIRNYGTDIADAVNDPERQEEMAKANKEYVEKITKNKKLEEEYEKNIQESLKNVSEAQEQNGWSDEQVDSAWQQLFQIVNDAVMGKFDAQTLQLVMNAQNYDKDVATAGQEGEVRGRNAKIEEKLRKSKAGDGAVHLDGKNGKVQERPSQQSLFALAQQAQ